MVGAAAAPAAPIDGAVPTTETVEAARSDGASGDERFDAALAAATAQESASGSPSLLEDPEAAAADDDASGEDVTAQAARPRPAELPSLTLGEMVSAIVDGPSPEMLQPADSDVGDEQPDVGGDVEVAAVDRVELVAERPEGEVTGAGAQVLEAGEAYLGVPYRWGGSDPDVGFDCSGLVQQAYADIGIELPRVSADQARAGEEVAGGLDAAKPGDLVYWQGDGERPNHIGIYAGEDRMLVAPSSGDVVRYQAIERPPDAVRRVLPDQ